MVKYNILKKYFKEYHRGHFITKLYFYDEDQHIHPKFIVTEG